MPGGLVQIMSYGTQDLTLTGNPQITFFNIVFRRYTNFGSKTVELGFDNGVEFGQTSILTIPKNSGDLLSKLFLKIELPKIDLQNLNILLTTINPTSNINSTYIIYYDFFNEFYNKLKNIVNVFFRTNDIINTSTYINDLSVFILKYINTDEYQQFFASVNYFFNNKITTLTNKINVGVFINASLFKNVDDILVYIYQNWSSTIMSYDLFKATINENMKILDNLNIVLYLELQNIFKINPNIKVSWVNKIAIYLINSIELYVGSNKINSLSDTYINNYGDLYYQNRELYNKIIGNKNEINLFDITKDSTILYLPIPLWFNNNYGLAFPLIALQYSSLQIKINFKKLIECIRIDINPLLSTSNIKTEIFNYLTTNNNIAKNTLNVSLYAEYIYLDRIERQKFAQSAHEYLITQLQEITFSKLSSTNNSFTLDFYHCCKNMFWMAKKKININDLFSSNYDAFTYTIAQSKQILSDNETLLGNYFAILYDPSKLFNVYTFINGVKIINNNTITTYSYDQLLLYFFNSKKEFIIDKNIVDATNLYYNGVTIIAENSIFFNILQSYNYYNSTPQKGLFIYSFSLHPTESQPSGSSNLSRIPNFTAKLQINKSINQPKNLTSDSYTELKSTDNIDEYEIIFQVENYNVIRFYGGIVATAFTY